MLLAEELALLALKPDTGRFPIGIGAELNACLAGVLVGELLLDGAVRPGDRKDRVVPVTGRPAPASPTLAAALEVVAEKGPKLRAVLSHMSRGLEQRHGAATRETLLDGLAHAGVLGPSTGGLRPRWPLLDHAARDSIVARLRAAAAGDGAIELGTALVLSMSGPAKLLEIVAPDRKARKQARVRIDHALDETDLAPVARTVRKIIEDAAAAAAGAATVSGAVVASG